MSRKMTFNLGPQNPDDSERILRHILRNALPNDDITLNCPSVTPAELTPNDQAAERVATAVEMHLAKKDGATNAKLDGQVAAKGEDAGAAKAKAEEIVSAKKAWRQTLNEQGMKVIVSGILKAAWDNKVEIMENVKQQLSEVVQKLMP
jgi:hypothetical protein